MIIDLLKANKALNTVNIKGKEYIPVNERIKAFRKVCSNGQIDTELVLIEDGFCIIKATVKDEEGNLLATGYASEKESSSYINKTSFIENCETSAVGRALGFCGIGIDTSIASSDEVERAKNAHELNEIVKQGQPERIESKKKLFEQKYDKKRNEVDDWLLGLGKVEDDEIEKELDRWIRKPTEATPYERNK